MPIVSSAVIRKEIERHQQERLESIVADVRARLLGNQRDAVEAARDLAVSYQRIAGCYDALRDRIASRAADEGAQLGEQFNDAEIRRQIATHEAIAHAASFLLSNCEATAERLHVQLSRLARAGADFIEDDDVVSSLKKVLAEALSAELLDARRAREQEEWADLPEYHGAEARSRATCLRCGEELRDSRKAFCSGHCRDVHQAVFGVREGDSSVEDDEE